MVYHTKRTGIFLLICLLGLFCTIAPVYAKSKTPVFSKKQYTVAVGKKVNLNSRLKKGKHQSLIWKSKNSRIASISKKGILKAKKKGKVVIIAKLKGTNKSARCKIIVVDKKNDKKRNTTGSGGNASGYIPSGAAGKQPQHDDKDNEKEDTGAWKDNW